MKLAAALDAWYPSKGREMNTELARLLITLGVPDAAEKTLAALAEALTSFSAQHCQGFFRHAQYASV